jgi:hypothetical protein
MTQNFGKSFLIPLAIAVFAALVLAPAAEAAREGKGGGAKANAGGGGRQQSAQVNNSHADARSNNVRSTSVNNVNNNNVNVNKNVNVNVQGNNGCCNNNGWDNDHHPIATMAAVGATAAIIGSMVARPPAGCVPVNYGGMVYQQCGSTWYQPQGSQYMVVSPPY